MRTLFAAMLFSVICLNAAQALDSFCAKPMAIPDRWEERSVPPNTTFDPGTDVYDPVLTGYGSAHAGEQLSIHFAAPNMPVSPGSYTPVDFPPLNRGNPLTGEDPYRLWLMTCSPFLLFSGDSLIIENAPVSDSTLSAFVSFITQDPTAYWDGANVISPFPVSPRVVTLLAYDPNYPPRSGRSNVILAKLLSVFVESVGPSSQINLRILDATADPVPTGPSTWGGLKRRYRN